jgi:hypothetical protein
MSKLTTELKVIFGRSSVERAIAFTGICKELTTKERYEISEASRILRTIDSPKNQREYCESLDDKTKENLILSILNKVCTLQVGA